MQEMCFFAIAGTGDAQMSLLRSFCYFLDGAAIKMPLLRSYPLIEIGTYKDFAPTELFLVQLFPTSWVRLEINCADACVR